MQLAGMVLAVVGVSAAAAVPHQTGWLTLKFDLYSPVSNTEAIIERMKVKVPPGSARQHHYAIEEESFEVYVPRAYDPNTPYGLLVWVSASPEGSIERYRGFRQMMDKHKLIWVGANNSGNQAITVQRRIPLALDAAYNMPMLYSIDRSRIYIAGLSGGGRVASVMAFHYSDIFNGGVFIIGANYWKPASIPEEGIYWAANATKPRPEFLRRAREFGRYVLLTGDNDVNRRQMHTYYEGLRREIDHMLYIQVPQMGHEIPPAEVLGEALDYVDNRQTEPTKPAEGKN